MASSLESHLDTEFDIVELGISGSVDLIPPNEKRNPKLFLSTLPFGPPPLLRDVTAEVEDHFLPDRLPIHDFERSQRFWPRVPDVHSLFSTSLTSPATTLQVERDPTSGDILKFCEIEVSGAGETAKTSFSLNRLPGRPEESVRGSSINYPFWPGGLDEPVKANLLEELGSVSFDKDLLSVPPGFANGMDFESKVEKHETPNNDEQQQLSHTVNLIHILTADEVIEDIKPTRKTTDAMKKISFEDDTEKKVTENLIEVKETFDEVISKGTPVLEISKTETNLEITSRKVWAEKMNTDKPIEDFHKRIPNMAKGYEFELDIFQKQAVLCLENNDSVFVAAHTSAGKTVVAEYAIAITQRNKTRAIYTSPIKALSNQKFYDFKKTFEDVGLLTGDLQINPKASCLIMTTEILRSMLYNGSDVIRDLEWVIFDEVHYINDSERGVVWEEVLIMLPAHVNLVLLSATVPNFMEFADWVGRTKQKKIYVISTSKRPVPLEHYLYTASDSKAEGQLHLFIDLNGNLLMRGYEAAMAAKKEKKPKSQSYGSKQPRQVLNSQQEASIWKGLINFLTKKNQLPVVAFTLSRKRCDENARLMKSLDLTTSSEKSEIHTFFQKCIQRLKPIDRKLPQVLSLQEMSKRGLGIHHSGILPILKEVVELLFQRQLVKLLFATETFAMGVNMPTKTVVFDSIRKHDGKSFRNLLPSEYIQMAGRAGRRGYDTTGMVILICKSDIPELSELRQMMLGKPTILESKFRLTYSMILNLLRLEQVRVVDMLKRSFLEVNTQKNLSTWQKELKKLKEYASNQQEVPCPICEPDLKRYYEASSEILDLQQQILEEALKSSHCEKILQPGRIITLQHIEKGSILGVILRFSKSNIATVLLLWDEENLESLDAIHTSSKITVQPEEFTLRTWQCCVALIENDLFIPDGAAGHLVLDINVRDIMLITTESLKLDGSKIMTDWAKRQQPRFRFEKPGPSCSTATQELLRLSEDNPNGLPYLDIAKELKLKNIDIPAKVTRIKDLQNVIENMGCTKCHSFRDHFHQIYEKMQRHNREKELDKKTSDESLSLHDDYLGRIEILKELQYIDESKIVSLKGKVACEISNHELMVTEILMQNVIKDLSPQEIAALLSCLVFQQKTQIEPELTGNLKKAKDKIMSIAESIGGLHRHYQLKDMDSDYEEQFKFGLVEVTLKWAQGVPFAEIAKMTDVQEGIIVRCIQRLDELLKDVRKAAKTIGEQVLEKMMEDASISIKRDIVFAASLYTQ